MKSSSVSYVRSNTPRDRTSDSRRSVNISASLDATETLLLTVSIALASLPSKLDSVLWRTCGFHRGTHTHFCAHFLCANSPNPSLSCCTVNSSYLVSDFNQHATVVHVWHCAIAKHVFKFFFDLLLSDGCLPHKKP